MDEQIIKKALNSTKKKRQILLTKAISLIAEGVLIHDPERIDIRGSLVCGKNVEIDINVIIEGDVELGNGVSIGANCILRNCRISDKTQVHPYSLIEESIIGKRNFIGPYSRLRPNSVIENDVQIGNYVEVKNSKIASKCRINHHSFVGDAVLEMGVTLGAGTITCNHDGFKINTIKIGEGAYIGSGSNLVAPLNINARSTIASGSTITDDVNSGTLVIARSRQVTIEGWNGPKSQRTFKDTSKK